MRTRSYDSDKGELSPHASCEPSLSLSKAGPHILMLVRGKCFPPYQGAPSSRLHSFAKYWSELTEVTVVSSVYNEPQGNFRRIKFPLTEKRREFLRLPFTPGRLRRLAQGIKADVVFVSFPLTWELLEGYLLAKRLRCPLIVDIRDLPVSQLPIDEGSLPRRIFNAWMQFIAYYVSNKASRIGTVTDILREEIIKTLGCSREKIFLIRNGSDTKLFEKALLIKKEFDIVFSGKFGPLENPPALLRYLRSLADLYRLLRILFISNFNTPPSIGREFLDGINQAGLASNVVVEAMGPPEDLPERLGRARLGLSSFAPGYTVHRGAVGAKVYEYLAAGLPVVGLMDPVFYIESGRSILGNSVGIMNANPEVLAKETAALLKDKKRLKKMSERARKIGERFDRKQLAEDYFYKVILPAWEEHNL